MNLMKEMNLIKTLIAGLLLATAGVSMAWQPMRDVQLVVPYGPGGSTDVIARIMATAMNKAGGRITVVNRPGASGLIGTTSVVNARADGHTMLLTGTAVMFGKVLAKPGSDYDLIKSFNHVALIGKVPIGVYQSTIAVDEPFDTVIKNTLDSTRMYSWGVSNPGAEFVAQMIAAASNNNIKIVRYQGSTPAHVDLMGGHIDFVIDTTSNNNAKAGTQSGRTLKVATANKDTQVDTTLDQFIPGIIAYAWFGVSLPAGTDPAISEYYNQLIQTALANPATQAKLVERGIDVDLANTNFAQWIDQDYKKYSKIHEHTNK